MSARRKFWGWGFEGQGPTEAEAETVRRMTGARFGGLPEPLTVPQAADFELPAARLQAPDGLAGLVTADDTDRLAHAMGQSYADIARAFLRQVPHAPDLVAYPQDAADVERLLDWADGEGAAVVPFGGGTSVCGGVEPDVGDDYPGVVSLDLSRMNRVRAVDQQDRCALIEAGARGPEFEAALKPEGLTLRHFPQSFELATLGGMIVTRSGGHFATLYTHIDEFVQSVEMVTPQGRMTTRRLPGSGAGPQPERLICGSEGILGIVTAAWMRLQSVPRHRASATVRFEDFDTGAEAVRQVARSGLNPANCRLLDPGEALMNGVGDGRSALLVLGFESADHPQEANLDRALEICADAGGQSRGARGDDKRESKGEGGRDAAAAAWRQAFLRMPFYREVLVPHGVIVDTFETACTWSAFPEFHACITAGIREAIRRTTGRDGEITCRFTHVYPDGPAPYYTLYAASTPERMLAHWRDIKLAANGLVVEGGGTVTHHHGVGRDHRPSGYDRERPDLYAEMLAGAKRAADPRGILNPGVLLGRRGGVLAGAQE
ncbi:FAD-binding oxidoreductase [Lentisalinibacter sediminis]|uniref:FAD-binding oxidoreductase n=1 Tax=Lentisalinibacter sediminis TaxID=2992237 RepID=UPI0038706FE7